MNFFRRDEPDIASSTFEEEEEGGGGFNLELSPEIQVAIAFVLTLIAGFICVMSILPAFRPAPPPPAQAVEPQPDFADPTAREAYAAAVETIRQQDPAAQLASGVGIYSPTINNVQLEAGRTGWTFFFYLPGSSEMARVTVGRNGQAEVADIQPWNTPPQLLDDLRWQTDSPAALAFLIRDCQEILESEAGARIEARLTTAAENRTILWNLKAESQTNPLTVCEVRVDATTGVLR